MLALVRTPHTELSLSGDGAEQVLDCLRLHFTVDILADDDEELLDITQTDYWRNEVTSGSLLTGCRLKHRMTQTRLAELTGIPQTVISEYENGKRKLTRKAALKLAAALETDPARFFKA